MSRFFSISILAFGSMLVCAGLFVIWLSHDAFLNPPTEKENIAECSQIINKGDHSDIGEDALIKCTGDTQEGNMHLVVTGFMVGIILDIGGFILLLIGLWMHRRNKNQQISTVG